MLAPTTDDGTVTAEISYEDVNGNVTTEVKEFELFVTEAMDMGYEDMYMDEGMYEEQAPGMLDLLRANIAWVLTAAAAVVIIAFIVIKRIRKKKLEKELEIKDTGTGEDDDEY